MNCKKDVSVIIVSYNTRELLRVCLTSLYEKTELVNFEVIVVDNCSSDQSIDMIKQFFQEVIVIALKENVGFGRANNEGIRIAAGKNIFLLNPDTILLNNAIKLLNDFLEQHAKVAVCGGNLYSGDNKPTHSYLMSLPALFSEIDILFGKRLSKYRYGNNVFFNHSGYPIKVGYVSGADMMVRKSVLDKVGLFDPDFFMYFEETELTYRIRKAGYDVMNVPDAQIVHLEGQSHKLKESREKMFLASRRLYLKKTSKNVIRYFLCQLIYCINAFIRVIYYALFHRDTDHLEIWKYRLRYF